MHLISIGKLRKDASVYPDALQATEAWNKTVGKARWRNLEEVKKFYPKTEAVGNFTVFNIKGNKYRLIVGIEYTNYTITNTF